MPEASHPQPLPFPTSQANRIWSTTALGVLQACHPKCVKDFHVTADVMRGKRVERWAWRRGALRERRWQVEGGARRCQASPQLASSTLVPIPSAGLWALPTHASELECLQQAMCFSLTQASEEQERGVPGTSWGRNTAVGEVTTVGGWVGLKLSPGESL